MEAMGHSVTSRDITLKVSQNPECGIVVLCPVYVARPIQRVDATRSDALGNVGHKAKGHRIAMQSIA